MKRFKKCFVICALLLVAVSFVNIKGNVKADEDIAMIVLDGYGKVEVLADYSILNFNIRAQDQEFDEGQKKINEIYRNISEQIKTLNEDNLTYITYTSCYPVQNGDIKVFEFSCSFSVKTKQTDSIQDIVNEVSTNGAISYYGAEYCLNDTKQAYTEALKLAKEDAIEKASTLNNCTELKAIVGNYIYSYPSNDMSGKIIVEAKVKCVFLCGESNDNIEENGDNNPSEDETKVTLNENISRKAFC